MRVLAKGAPTHWIRGRWFIALTVILTACVFSATGSAGDFAGGFLSWDVNFPGNSGQFDIVNQTGPNSSSFPDTTFPISNSLNLSGLSLVVHFSNGSTVTEPGSYFTL